MFKVFAPLLFAIALLLGGIGPVKAEEDYSQYIGVEHLAGFFCMDREDTDEIQQMAADPNTQYSALYHLINSKIQDPKIRCVAANGEVSATTVAIIGDFGDFQRERVFYIQGKLGSDDTPIYYFMTKAKFDEFLASTGAEA